MKRFLFAGLYFFAFAQGFAQQSAPALIPAPLQYEPRQGVFRFDESVQFLLTPTPGIMSVAAVFNQRLYNLGGSMLRIDSVRRNNTRYISATLNPDDQWCGAEGYRLRISPNGIDISAQNEAGIFYAFQTLSQLMPPDFLADKPGVMPLTDVSLPCMNIDDRPRFSWRGMNLDCGRHFMEVDFIKRYIDLLALHKMNVFHWHLTEDQGWRIEIKKYPELTRVGAWRKEDDGSIYGGFYTQDQIREVVAYAAARYITVVPEIEMPGHSVAALASYPQLSCTGGPFEVEKRWGVFKDIYCAGNDSSFAFIEDVLVEVMALFPSTYIHIGGDEAPKTRWEACPKCQARMEAEHLSSGEELQSYFIRRIEKFLNAHGRRLIGWDEILEGGLAPSATVQSWRGMDGGMEAAESGHDAIMSPTSHCYFDYSVSSTNLEHVYSFEPVPAELPSDKQHHILGAECCMWTETAPQEVVDSRVFPRLCALCEVMWSDTSGRSFGNFHQRMQEHYKRLDALGVRYGYERDPIQMDIHYDAQTESFVAHAEAGQPGLSLHFSIDGTDPDASSPLLNGKLQLMKTMELKVAAIRSGAGITAIESRKVVRHAALGKPYAITYPYSKKYVAGGDSNLTDGLRGTASYRDRLWQGYEGVDFEAVIHLGRKTSISKVSVGTLQSSLAWIYHPLRMEVFISEDAADWVKAGECENTVPQTDAATSVQDMVVAFKATKAKFVKVYLTAMHRNPDWHPGAGGKTWLFLDEIIVE